MSGNAADILLCGPCLRVYEARRARAVGEDYLRAPGDSNEDCCCLCAEGAPWEPIELVCCSSATCHPTFFSHAARRDETPTSQTHHC